MKAKMAKERKKKNNHDYCEVFVNNGKVGGLLYFTGWLDTYCNGWRYLNG